MLRYLSIITIAASLLPLTACDTQPIQEIEFRTSVDNSEALNGIYLNGIYLNGIYLNGIYLNSSLLNGATVGGVGFLDGLDPDGNQVTCVELDKKQGKLTVINGTDDCDDKPESDEKVKGEDVVDTELTFTSPEGEYRLYIDEAEKDPDHGGHHLHLYHYSISAEVKGENGWTGVTSPLCYDGAGNPTEALLIPGSWHQGTGTRTEDSLNTVTVACRHAALAKCVEWGYPPGEEPELHQACVRLVRADYEGIGDAHTANGTTIYISDDEDINTEDDDPDLVKEAEWGPDGAVCLNRSAFRRSDLTGCSDPSDPSTCFPGIPECSGSPTDLSIKTSGARIVTAVMSS